MGKYIGTNDFISLVGAQIMLKIGTSGVTLNHSSEKFVAHINIKHIMYITHISGYKGSFLEDT